MSKKPTFAVLGAGNGGTATAADLTVRGFDVHLWEFCQSKVNYY
jgi:glycerol-3-phosphate dehydrogenase